MKKKMAMFVAVVCLVFWGGGMTVCAEDPYTHCYYCGAALNSYMQHLGDWDDYHTFVESGTGKKVTCYERHNLDKEVRTCPNGHGIIWVGEPVETATHSLSGCPYK